jgi:hypothetical protein
VNAPARIWRPGARRRARRSRWANSLKRRFNDVELVIGRSAVRVILVLVTLAIAAALALTGSDHARAFVSSIARLPTSGGACIQGTSMLYCRESGLFSTVWRPRMRR